MAVALRKESVDRNSIIVMVGLLMFSVALRKESVDRNPPIELCHEQEASRSPQGERG